MNKFLLAASLVVPVVASAKLPPTEAAVADLDVLVSHTIRKGTCVTPPPADFFQDSEGPTCTLALPEGAVTIAVVYSNVERAWINVPSLDVALDGKRWRIYPQADGRHAVYAVVKDEKGERFEGVARAQADRVAGGAVASWRRRLAER